MNKYIYIGSLALMLAVGTSCEDFKFGDNFLEKPITTDITIDTVFAHRKYAEQVLTEVYHSLPDFLCMDGKLAWGLVDAMTDIGDVVVNSNVANPYYMGQMSAATTPGWMPYRLDDTSGNFPISGPVTACRMAYIYLENVDRVPDMSEEEKTRRKGEAWAIIAYHYMDMLRWFGGMPWIDHAYSAEDEMDFSRMTVEEHVNKIVELCDRAASMLPWTVSENDYGRMTAAGALALKNRALTFAASPLFNSDQPYLDGAAAQAHNTWYGNYDPGRWQRALDSGLEFLRRNAENGNVYALVQTGDPRKDFFAGYYNRYTGETLINSNRFNRMTQAWYYCVSVLKWGNSVPSGIYADMFETADGEPFDWSNPKHAAYPFFDEDGNMTRDPRLYETLWVNGDKFMGRTVEMYAGGREAFKGNSSTMGQLFYNGYGLRKFILDNNTELFNHYYQCPLIRLSEIYLDIAEAMNELGIATQKDEFGRDAYDYVNLVRNRVNMPDLTSAKAAPGEALREAILHERVVEFGFEECRYFDIVRWKKYEDWLNRDYYRLECTKGSDGSMNYSFSTDMYQHRVWIERWSNKYYLIPIPVDEINKKYGLIQNPGWE